MDWFEKIVLSNQKPIEISEGVVGWIRERMRSNLLSEIESHFG